jgi:hypothetical protein
VSAICFLRWLAQWNDIGCGLDKPAAGDLHAMLDTGKDSCVVAKRLAWFEMQKQFDAALRAGMLRQQKDAGACSVRSGTITEPRCKRHAGGIFGSDAAHIEDNRTEATTLQEKIDRTEGLLDSHPGFSSWSGRAKDFHWTLRFDDFILRLNAALLWLCISGRGQ